MKFGDQVAAVVADRRSQVVLGLDPDPARIGPGALRASAICLEIIAAAGPASAACKPQLACFERFGADGWKAFEEVAQAASDAGLVVIADAKRGDIGQTAQAYAEAFLRDPVDAMTVNPMLGTDGAQPFLDAAQANDRGLFFLVRTSNPGAADLEDLPLADGRIWHEAVADLVAAWGAPTIGTSGLSAVGAVVGATVPERLVALRRRMPHQIFLLPGVGAQGGQPEDLAAAFGGRAAGALVSASRSIIYADDPAQAAEELRAAVWSAWEAGNAEHRW